MRRLILGAAVTACLGLAACENGAVSQAEATPEAPKRSLARPAQMYQGQDNIHSLDSASVEVGKGGALMLTAKGATASAGWTDAAFLPRIYAATPPDGVYEIDVIATQPTGPAAQVVTPVEVKGEWNKYTDGRVKGVKLISKTNEVTAMVPQAQGAAQ